MKFMNNKLLSMALALVSCIEASPTTLHKRDGDTTVLIGYRTVNEEQAAMYNTAGRVVWIENKAGMQLGEGVYISPGPGEYKAYSKLSWFCTIYAEPKVIERLSKVWVPEKASFSNRKDVTLFFKADNIDAYIATINPSWDPAKTLRLSRHQGYAPYIQLLIPPALAKEEAGLNLKAHCVEEFPGFEGPRVDYKSGIWKANSGGEFI